METPGRRLRHGKVAKILLKAVPAVDSVTVTISSAVLKNAVKVCVEEAGGDEGSSKKSLKNL